MNFQRANIDRAIVMTQYDLRGFAHPLGFREKYKSSAGNLDATTANFMSFAADCGNVPTDEHYADYFSSSYKDYLAMCQRMAECCDESQKEAIRLIVREIVKQSEEMKAEVAAGKRAATNYLAPLKRGNSWGKAVLALAKAFEVKLKKTK